MKKRNPPGPRARFPRFLPFLSFLAVSLLAQGGWILRDLGAGRPGRSGHAMAFDSARGKTVLFGGSKFLYPKTIYFSDTWEWDGKKWTLVPTKTRPPARESHAMAFDSARKRVVLFGGCGGTAQGGTVLFSDTWEFDGKDWTRMTPATSPPARVGHCMAYDSRRRRTVLFGGIQPRGSNSTYFEDTWEWDGKSWIQRTPPLRPFGRSGSAMAFDSSRGKTVLFGGYRYMGSSTKFLQDTWEWDGWTWNRLRTPSPPPGRADHAMAYESRRGCVILFGGREWSKFFGATWIFKGGAWSKVTGLSSPWERCDHAMVFDSVRGRAVLFGGYLSCNNGYSRLYADTWELSLEPPAAFVATGRGCAGSNKKTPLLRAGSLPRLGETMVLHLEKSPPLTWTLLIAGIRPAKIDLGHFGAPGCVINTGFLFQYPDFTNLNGNWSFPPRIGIPCDARLLGAGIHFQVLVADAGANPFGFIVSNPARATFGF